MKAGEWRKVWLSVGATVALLAMVWLVGTALAQGPEGGDALEGDVSLAATVASKINYQGRLTDPGGIPLTGTFPMRFQIYDNSTGGALLWDSGVTNVGVEGGLFNVQLSVNQADFNGQALWLRVYVNGEWLTPRQELAAVPYALSLRPGAQISGDPTAWDGWVLKANMTGTYPVASAIQGSTATGSAVYGNSTGGLGVYGYSQDGYAVYGHDAGTNQGRGYGGYFSSDNGVGVYGYSGATAYYTNNWMPGVYGRSANGVGVMGWGEGTGYMGIGLLGYGRGGEAALLRTYSGYLILGQEDVYGDGMTLENRFEVTYGGYVYADGTYTSPASDMAELLPASESLEPGDVLVIGPDGQLARSSDPNQTAVVGVYSTKPGFLGGVAENLGADEAQAQLGAEVVAGEKVDAMAELAADGKVPLAIAGVVPVKVSAENGAIQPGDLLTTSSLPGHAMKASPIELDGVEIYRPGTIIGKALEPLAEGIGVISALMTLQ
jgi:hypothetical protein